MLGGQYGYYKMAASYFFCHDPIKMGHIFDEMRNDDMYISSCGEWKVKYVRDLTTGHDNSQPGGRAILPVSSSSYMLTYTFENGCVATFRGTSENF